MGNWTMSHVINMMFQGPSIMHCANDWCYISIIVPVSNIYWKLLERQSFEPEITEQFWEANSLLTWRDEASQPLEPICKVESGFTSNFYLWWKYSFKILKNSHFVYTVMCGVNVDRDNEHTLGWVSALQLDWCWIIISVINIHMKN